MAKQKKADYPKVLKDLKDYVLITDDNKAKGLVVGRIIYDIDAKTLVCRCSLEIRPRHEKGHWFVTNHQVHGDFDYWVIKNEESVQEYRDYLMKTVGRVKEEGRCYIRLKDKVGRYERK